MNRYLIAAFSFVLIAGSAAAAEPRPNTGFTSRSVQFDHDRREIRAVDVRIEVGEGSVLTARESRMSMDSDSRAMELTGIELESGGRVVATADRGTFDPFTNSLTSDAIRFSTQ